MGTYARIIRMNITFVRILLFIDAQIVAHHFLDLLTGIPNAFCNFSSSDGTGHYSLAAEALEEDFGRFAVGREAAEDGASALWEAIWMLTLACLLLYNNKAIFLLLHPVDNQSRVGYRRFCLILASEAVNCQSNT